MEKRRYEKIGLPDIVVIYAIHYTTAAQRDFLIKAYSINPKQCKFIRNSTEATNQKYVDEHVHLYPLGDGVPSHMYHYEKTTRREIWFNNNCSNNNDK